MIRVKAEAVKQAMAERGWDVVALAYHTGLSFLTATRLVSGKHAAGVKAISALLRVFPEAKFEDFFYVTDRDA